MAVRKMTEGASSWNNKMPFPKDRYQIRCIEEEFGLSSGDNPMITRTFEILSPETVPVGDRTISVGGRKVIQYRITKVRNSKEDVSKGEPEWNEEKSDKSFGQLRDELNLVGYDKEEIDDENPPLIFKDKIFDAILYGKEDTARKAPAKGQRVGEAIKDANGKEIKSFQIQIESILGLSTVGTNKPF
jgi:hypothetical protein